MIRFSIKDYLPRSLFVRAALIYLIPVLTILAVMSVVFVQRLYENVSRQMTNVVVDEINLILSTIENAPDADAAIARATTVADPLGLKVSFDDPMVLSRRGAFDMSGAVIVETLLSGNHAVKGVDLLGARNRVLIGIETSHGAIVLDGHRRRFSARNPHQFLVLMGFTAIVMTLIAMLYLRGQVRPIRRLAAAATAFGKGRNVPYRPTGAMEVREAGHAFIEMRDRIERQIEQRTLILSGVSHDLRTPLTRMRLSLGLMEENEETRSVTEDIDEMERMLNTFLDFARSDTLGEVDEVSPKTLVEESVEKFLKNDVRISINEIDPLERIMLRPLALHRALTNLVGNAARYGTTVSVSFRRNEDSVSFFVEDDGPGIAKENRAEAVKPFTRLDKSRNQNFGPGVGLGLSIASDIARQHGGQLVLSKSEEYGGLCAEIRIPQ